MSCGGKKWDCCTQVRPVGRLSLCGKHFNVAIFSDTIPMINGKLCMMLVPMHRALPIRTTFSDLDCISMSQQCQTVLTEKFMLISDQVETFYDCWLRQVYHEYSIIIYLFIYFVCCFCIHWGREFSYFLMFKKKKSLTVACFPCFLGHQ